MLVWAQRYVAEFATPHNLKGIEWRSNLFAENEEHWLYRGIKSNGHRPFCAITDAAVVTIQQVR
jgi:hypothetical protein